VRIHSTACQAGASAGGLEHRVYGVALDAGWTLRGGIAGGAEEEWPDCERRYSYLGSWLGGVRWALRGEWGTGRKRTAAAT
jgi:hypothetical protein